MVVKPGERYLVFDNKFWGGKDKGDNSQFWKEAEVISFERGFKHSENTATVRFDHDGRTSRGHFTQGFKKLVK